MAFDFDMRSTIVLFFYVRIALLITYVVTSHSDMEDLPGSTHLREYPTPGHKH